MNTGVTIKMPYDSHGVGTLNFTDWDLKITTSDNLKSWIFLKTGHPECTQRLLITGKLLGDSAKPNLNLYEQNVREGSTVHVVTHTEYDDRIRWQFARQIMRNSPWISWEKAKSIVSTSENEDTDEEEDSEDEEEDSEDEEEDSEDEEETDEGEENNPEFTLAQMRELTNLGRVSMWDTLSLFAEASDEDGMISRKGVIASFKLLVRSRKTTTDKERKMSEMIATQLFDLFEQQGGVDFNEFVTGLSVLCKGKRVDKVESIFQLYDYDFSGYITLDQLIQYLKSIYRVIYATHPEMRARLGVCPQELAEVTAEQAFANFDLGKKDMFSLDDFKSWFSNSEAKAQDNRHQQQVVPEMLMLRDEAEEEVGALKDEVVANEDKQDKKDKKDKQDKKDKKDEKDKKDKKDEKDKKDKKDEKEDGEISNDEFEEMLQPNVSFLSDGVLKLNPHLKPCVLKKYTDDIDNLHEKLFGNREVTNVDWLEQIEDILSCLTSFNTNTRKKYLNSICMCYNIKEDFDKEVWNKYFKCWEEENKWSGVKTWAMKDCLSNRRMSMGTGTKKDLILRLEKLGVTPYTIIEEVQKQTKAVYSYGHIGEAAKRATVFRTQRDEIKN
jgi:hypothetical protein